MKRPYLLHMFNATKNVSPFDVNMAYEAEIDKVIPYTEVVLDDIHTLTQDTIFSRGSRDGLMQTGIFIGGREFGMAIDMLNRARAAMVPPFEVSVFADPSGAITTASAMIACVEYCLKKQSPEHTLEDKRLYILGGTGPVGICAGVLAARHGAKVFLSSRRGTQVSKEYASEYKQRFQIPLQGVDGRNEQALCECIAGAEVIIGAAKAGVQVLSRKQLNAGKTLLVVADANAVPPAGIEGVHAQDFGAPLATASGTALAIGALAIGRYKYQIHLRLLQMMKSAKAPLYLDHEAAFEVARQVVREKTSG